MWARQISSDAAEASGAEASAPELTGGAPAADLFARQLSGAPTSPSGGGQAADLFARQISGSPASPSGGGQAASLFARQISGAPSDGGPAEDAVLDEAGGPPAALPEGERTKVGELVDLFVQAQVRDRDGKLLDVKILEFLGAARKYVELLATFGKGVSMMLGDVQKNMAGVDTFFHKDREARRTHRLFMQVELDSGVHKPATAAGARCRLRDPSGACQMQWMLRGMEFFGLMLKLQMEGHKDALPQAYAQTLQPYHSWVVSAAVRALFVAMPSKDSICSTKVLCPALADDPPRLTAAIQRDVVRLVGVMLPTVRLMINTCREFGLWEQA